MNTVIIAQGSGFYGFALVIVPFSKEQLTEKLSTVLDMNGEYGVPFEKTASETVVRFVAHSGPEYLHPVEWDTGALADDRTVLNRCLRALGLVK